MKKIIYIGNKLEKHGLPPTTIDYLPEYLAGEKLHFATFSSFKNKFFRFLHMLYGILIHSKSSDLVLIDTYSTANFWYAYYCGLISRLIGLPYIFILHGGKLDQRFERLSEKKIKLFRDARCNVVPSNYLKEKLGSFNFDNINLIPNSIKIASYPFLLRSQSKPRLLWVRAFDEVYDPSLAIEVLELLFKRYPEAELCMVGPDKDGSLKKCKELAAKINLPVKFPGKLDKETWIRLSRDYDIFMNTTMVDNTPVSVIEAMALGLPLVSTNVGGIPYLIENGKNGLLIETGNTEEMVKAIEKLLQVSELAYQLSLNGRKKAEEFDWEKVKRLWLELLG